MDIVSLNSGKNKEYLLIRQIFNRTLPIFRFSNVQLQHEMVGHVRWPTVIYITVQGLYFLLDFDFPTWIVAAEMAISLKRDMWIERFDLSGRLSIFDSTLLVKHD